MATKTGGTRQEIQTRARELFGTGGENSQAIDYYFQFWLVYKIRMKIATFAKNR